MSTKNPYDGAPISARELERESMTPPILPWHQYKRKGLSEMRPYVPGEDIAHVSISEPDRQAGSPKQGDMIARNPKNHADQWLVARKYFEENLEPVAAHDPHAETVRLLKELLHHLDHSDNEAAFPSMGRARAHLAKLRGEKGTQ